MQDSRVWHQTLSHSLLQLNFTQTKSDYSLFTKFHGSSTTIILAYVDDLLITRNDLTFVQHLKDELHKTFKIKDFGELKYFLGLEFTTTADGLYVSQRKYTLDILNLYNMTHCKSTYSPQSQRHVVMHNKSTHRALAKKGIKTRHPSKSYIL